METSEEVQEELTGSVAALDKAIAYADEDNYEASAAWSAIASTIVAHNASEVTRNLAIIANEWVMNPSPEGYSEFLQAAAYYRQFTESQG